jgi:hypothetical protein
MLDNENGKKEDNKEIKEKEKEKKEVEKKEEILKEPLGEKISILHYIENPNIIDNIESPRSIRAMFQIGLIMDDIRYLSFSEYINNNPTFISLPKEIQKKRYDFWEKYRIDKIQKIKELRDAIIEEEKINNDNNGKNEEINININEENNKEIKSSAINEELRQFERMKRKNEMDLINRVEFELKRQIMLKEGEGKIRRQNMKIDNFRKSMEIKNEIEKKKNEKEENNDNQNMDDIKKENEILKVQNSKLKDELKFIEEQIQKFIKANEKLAQSK